MDWLHAERRLDFCDTHEKELLNSILVLFYCFFVLITFNIENEQESS